jgi:glycosyltransferase involved in cell wall biosynthesis
MADFVVLATADWDHPLWTNKQHTALSLVEHGHRVLYVESLGLRPPRASTSDGLRIVRRLQRMLRPPRQVRPNLWVWSPAVLPGGIHGHALVLNRGLCRAGLTVALRLLRFHHPLLWTYNPLTRLYLALNDFSSSVYHCVDSIQDQPGMPSALIERCERELCASVNLVLTTAPELQRRLEPLNPHTHFFGNVADASHFHQALESELPCPDDLATVPSPRVLFVGALDAYKLDLEMLEDLIRNTPQWSYVLVGPIAECDPSTDLSSVLGLSNVHGMGIRPYRELPAWLAHSDVAFLPLRLNEYTRQMFPMKFFEYLASGCPTVATAIPSLQSHQDVALLCPPSATEFEVAIRQALAGSGPPLALRLERASQHTYHQRTQCMLELLQQLGSLPDSMRGCVAPLRSHAPWAGLFNSILQRLTVLPFAMLDQALLALKCRRWSTAVLRFGRWSVPWNTRLLERLARREVALKRWDQAMALFAELWCDHGTVTVLHRFLFRRGARPVDVKDQIALFEAISRMDALPLVDRRYSQIVLAHRALQSRDGEGMVRAVLSLDQIVIDLEQDSGTWVCQRPNRANRVKQLISCYSTLLRLHLWQGNWDALATLGQRVAGFTDRFDPAKIDQETSYRMTRNLCRALSIDIIFAYKNQDLALLSAAKMRLDRQCEYCQDIRHQDNPAQENHRVFAADLIKVVAEIEADIKVGKLRSSSFYKFIILLLANKSPDRSEEAEYLNLFPWYSFDKVDQDLNLND